MSKKLKLSLVALSSLVLASCATIFSTNTYPVRIDSNPQSVSFKIYKETSVGNLLISTGTTPKIVTLTSGGDHYFQKNRYLVQFNYNNHVYSTHLVPTLDGWYFGNLLIGGPLGLLIIDPLTGDMFKLPETFSYDLTIASQSSLQIKSINDLTSEQRAHLIPLPTTTVQN